MLAAAWPGTASLEAAALDALMRGRHDIARELIAAGASMASPAATYLFTAALAATPADIELIRTWLTAPLPHSDTTAADPDGGRRLAAVTCMRALASEVPPVRAGATDALALLLANVDMSPDEAYGVLVAAVAARNVAAVAAMAVAAKDDWRAGMAADGRGRAATYAAAFTAAEPVHSIEQSLCILDFLVSSGADPDTPTLRLCLLQAAQHGHLYAVSRLMRLGVATWADDANVISWAVEGMRLDVLAVIVEAWAGSARAAEERGGAGQAVSPMASAASAALALIPADARDPERTVLILRALGVLCATIDGARGARGGQNGFIIAAVRGNVKLTTQLSKVGGVSAATASAAVPLVVRAITVDNVDDMVAILAVLVQCGACGASVDGAILEALPTSASTQVLNTLLSAGMDPVAAGKAIQDALRLPSSDALQLLCAAASPHIPCEALEAALHEALFGPAYDKEMTLMLLGVVAKQAEGQSAMLDRLLASPACSGHRHRQDVAQMLLAHGASVNAGGGAVLRAAATAGDVEMLQQLLRLEPSTEALSASLMAAIGLPSADMRLRISKSILESSSTANLGQSGALVSLIREHGKDCGPDLSLIELLLDKHASVDEFDGEALHLAAKSLSVSLVQLLLASGRPSSRTVARAFDTAWAHWTATGLRNNRVRVLELLLGSSAGVDSARTSQALIEAALRDPADVEIPRLLLAHGADSLEGCGAALRAAITAGSLPLAELLLSHGARPHLRPDVATAAFRATREVPKQLVSDALRLDLYRQLLATARGSHEGIGRAELDAALLQACLREPQPDLAAVTLLVAANASVNVGDGRALACVAATGDAGLLAAMLGGTGEPAGPRAVAAAFEAAVALPTPDTRLAVVGLLVQRGVEPGVRSRHSSLSSSHVTRLS